MVGLGTAPIVQLYREKSIILPDVSRVLACLYEKDIKFETQTASYKSLLRLQASSHAPVPFYDGPTFLEESRGICRYIAEKYEPQGYPFLLGKDALERASVEQWLHNEEHAFNPPSRALYCHLAFPLDEEDRDDIERHTRKLEEVLEVYEQRLSDSRFLAGNKFTLADLVHLPNSHYITASDKFVYLYDTRKNVSRWWEEISTRKSWQQVLRDMKGVEEEQNKKDELEKQQRQKEHPRTSGHPIRIYSKKQTSTEPRTVLVPPADTVSSSIVSPLPTDTFPDEALVSSSQSAPTAKTSATLSKETTVLNAPDETPPTSVQSTPTISRKHRIPVQSTKDDASHATAKKPPVDDAAKSSTKDASIPELTVKDLHSRHKPSSSKVVSNNLDVFDYYPSHTDEETPYIEPTPQRTSGTLDTFSGSSIGTGHTKTSSISAEEEPDQPSASDLYKSDSGATDIDSQYKESIPYSGRAPPKFEPSDSSASKPHTTDGRRRLAEQWHTATPGLNDLKQDADHLMSTQQGKQSKDLKKYPPQDSEQATSHPVPEEPMSIELVQRQENITLRPYTDQRSRGIVEDKESSDQRSALLLPSTQEHDATPSRQEAAKDAGGRIPSQAGYPGVQDTNKQPRRPASVPRQRAAQDARGTFGESKAADSIISSESFPNATQSSLPRQDLDGARHTTAPFQKRYSGMEDTSKQAKDKISTPWQMVDKDAEDTTKDTQISDSSSSQVQPSYFQGADAPSWKQEITEDRHSAASAIQEKHSNVEDTTGISRDVDFELGQTISHDDQDTFKEKKSVGPSLLRDEQPDTWQAASTLPEQELNQDGHSVAPPSQRRYPSSTHPSKTRYQIAKDASKQPRVTAPTPKKKAAQDDNGTSEESITADQVASTKQPLNAWRAPISPQIQEVKSSSRTDTSLPKRYPDDDEEDLQVADTASASRQIAPDGDNDIYGETKIIDSTTTIAKPLYTQQGALPLPRQAEVEDAQGKGTQSRQTIPEPQKLVARDARDPHGERKTATPEHKTNFNFGAEEPYRKDTIDDQELVPPLFSKEPTTQFQPTSESLQEAASRGGLSTQPSIIEQWQRASVPLNDVTSSSGDDKFGMATINQKLTPMSQQPTPSVEGANQMAKESGDQRVERHAPIEAETSVVQSASTSFPGASTAHHATTDDKFAKQSIIDERVGEPTKMQASTPDFAPAHTKRATPDGHEIDDPELVRDQAILQEDVRDANLRANNVAKDTFKETKVADSTPSSAKPMYTQPPAPTPRHAELEDTRDEGIERRGTVPDRQKMVERRAGTGGKQLPDRMKAIPPSRQATTEDALGEAGDSIQSPDILDRSKKSRGNHEEAKGPGLTLSEKKSLGAQDAQRTTGESTTPTAGQRKDISIRPQPDVQDGLKESKLSVADWNGLGSLSSEGKDVVGAETTITGEKPLSMERRRETSKKSESTTPKARPADSQGSVKEQASSIYQKKPLVAQDIQEQAETIPVGEKAGPFTPKHQQASDAPNTFDEKLNASEPARAKTQDDFSAEESYGDVSSDDQKVAPPLLSRELTSQVQPPPEPSHDAALHHIDQWQHASMPLHGQKPTPMKHEERVEPPVPIEAEKSGVQRASPPFPGASMDYHATIDDKFAKQSIIDERVGKPIQMQTSSPDTHPASEPTKRATRKGHEIGDLELVSTPDGQISEATKARDDPATVHEDVLNVNLSPDDVGKDTFKETKVAESTPSIAKPMYAQQPDITPSRQTHVGEARDKSMQSRETIPEQQKMVDRKTGISGEQSSDRQKAIHPPRQVAAAEDAPTGDTIQSPYIPDSSNESRGTFEEAIGPGSTLTKAQDFQLTRGESTMPTADQRKDWKDANNDKEKSFSTERLREMFQESESSTPKTQPTDSQGYSMVDKMSPVYQKGPLPAQESQEEIIQAGEKTPEHQEPSGAPYTYDEKLSASSPARADIRDDHSAEEPYKKYTADDQKVASSLSSKEPSSQVQPISEPLQRAVPDGDMPSKSFTIAQWQRTSAPLHGVNTDSGDAEVAMSSSNDQKLRPTSQEAILSSPVPIRAELSDVGRTAPSLPEAARADNATVNDKFVKQSNIDERVGSAKQTQQPIKAAHPASAFTKRTTPDADEAGDLKLVRTPERHRLEAAKATQDPAKIHVDVHDASLSTHDAAIDEKTATYHASGDDPLTGYVHDRQARPPASTQAQPTVETPHDPDSSQYVHSDDSRKTELGKPIVTDQEATTPIPGSTLMDPQRASTLPAEVAHSGQRSAPSDKGSARAVQPVSPVEKIKADNNVSAADYTNAPQMIFWQQAKPSEPSTIGIPASDALGVIQKIQEVTPDDRLTDDSDAPQGTEPGQDSAQSVQPPFSTESTEAKTVVTPPDQTKDVRTITHHQAITPAPETAKTIFPGANQEVMASIVGPTSMDPQLAGTLPAEVARYEQKPTPSDKGSARAAQPVSPVEPKKADSNGSSADYSNTPQMVFRQQARPSERSTIEIPASDTQGVIRKIWEVTPDDRPTDESGKPFVQSEEQVSYASPAISGQEETASLRGATVSPSSDAQVASPEVQEVSPDYKQTVESTTPLFSSGNQGSHVESAFRPDEKKFTPSDQELSHSAEQPTSSKPSEEQTVVPTAEQINEQPTIVDQRNTPYTRGPHTSDDALDTTPTHDNVHPAGRTETDRRPLSVQGEQPKFATQAPPPHVAKGSLDPDNITTDQAMAPIMSPSVPSVAPLGTQPGTDSVQAPRQASMPSTVDLETVPETHHGIPEGESTPTEQKFAISDKEPAHTSEPPSSEELSKKEANAAAGDQPNVPQGPETTGRHQVKSPSSDAREASRKDQQPSHAVLPEQTTYAVLPSDLYDRPIPEVDSSVVDKETTLLSSQAQTSAAEPDLTPISGDISPASSQQNQEAQPPVTTQAPTTQSLQGSAPTQDDSLRTSELPSQASTDQVMEPVTSSAEPPYAPQGAEPGQDSAQSVQPPFSTESTEANTVVTPPDQTKDMRTITHHQAITPAPETAKTIFPGANQEVMAPIVGPTSMDPQLAGTLPAEVARYEQKPTPSDKGSARAAQPVSPVEPKKADSNVSSADYSNAPQMVFRQQAGPSEPSTIGIPASDTQGVIRKIREVTPDDRPTDDSGKPFVRSEEQVSYASPAIPGQEETASLPDATVSPSSDAQVASPEVQKVSPDYKQAAFGPGEVGAAENKLAPSDQELPRSAEQPTSGKPMKEQMGISTAEQIKEQPTTVDQQNTPYTREPRTSEDVLDTTRSHGDVHSTGSIEPDRIPLSVQGEEPKSATEAHPPGVVKDSLDTEAISTNASIQSLKPSTTLDARGATHGELGVAEQKSSLSGQASAYSAKPPSSAEPRSKEVGDLGPSSHLSSTTEPRNGDAIVSAPDQAKDSQTVPGQQVRLPAPSFYTQHPSGKRQEDEPADKLHEAKSSKPPPSVSMLDTQHVAAPDQVAVGEEKVSLSGHYPAPAPGTELHNADADGQKLSPSVQDSVHSVQPSLSIAPTKEDSVAAATDQTSTLEKMIDQNDLTPAPDKAKTPFLGSPDTLRASQKSTDDDHMDEKLPGQGQVSPSRHVSESPEGHSDDVDKGTAPGSSRVATSNTGADSTEIGGDARLSSGDVPASSSFTETQDLQGSAYAKNVPSDSLGKFESSGHLSTDEALEPRMSPSVPSAAPLGSVSDKEPAHTSEPPSSAEPRKEETNVAAGDQPNLRRGPETTGRHQIKAPSPDAREALRKDQQASRDDEHTSNLADPLAVPEEKASYAGRASEGPSSEVSSDVDRMMELPSNQAQTSSTGPESTPISGDTRLSSDVPATSYLQNKEADTPVATQVSTPMAPQESASTQNVHSDAPQGTEPDQVAHASGPPFSAEPNNESSYAGRASESLEGSPVVDAKGTLPSRQVQTASTGSDSTPISGDVSDSNSVQNQEAQPSAATQAPTVQAEGSASTKNEPADSLGDIKSLRQLPTGEVVAPITSFAAPSDSSQGTEPGTNSVLPSEASFGFSSDEKPTMSQGDQAKTLPNGDLPTSQVVGQSESADSKGMGSLKNLKGASTDENPKMLQQIEQFNARSYKDEASSSETRQPREGDGPANSYQNNISQSQAEASDKSAEQSYPGTQNKDTDSSRMDDSTDPSKPGEMDD